MAFEFSRRSALLAVIGGVVAEQGAPGAEPVSILPASLRRGFNLPDQAPLRAGHIARKEILSELRRRGMTHVRLPVVAEAIMPAFSGPATISSAMDDLSGAVDMLLALDYAVTIDMHPGAEFSQLLKRAPEAADETLTRCWRRVARHMTRWPSQSVFAELLNEPPTTDGIWRQMAEKLVREVRAELPKSFIIVGPAPYQTLESLSGWSPFADRRIIYACHYYNPMLFTHQGADWEKESPWSRAHGVPFPSRASDPVLLRVAREADAAGDQELSRELRQMAERPRDFDSINAEFSALGRWSARNSAPVIVNEFGALKGKTKRRDRYAWLATVRGAAESQGFGWAHWDYATSFGILDGSGALDDEAVRALLPR